ncbi:MAG: hypothetical protein AABY22_32580, partial [Nanoarchaeota archaeon]
MLKNDLNKKREMSLFEIAILVIATFSFAYIIHQTDPIIPLVSAEVGDSLVCCPETKAGAICQDILSSRTDSCKVETQPMKCEEFSNCELGCCIDDEEGICNERATRQKCLADGGRFEDDEDCNLQNGECENVCCILGSETAFVSEKRCERLASVFGFEKYFENVGTEVDCILKSKTQERGACVISSSDGEGNEENPEASCKFTTKADCLNLGGDFNKDYLCSAEELKTLGVNCEKQTSLSCIEGEDEIYWFDSCGNKENIYSSDKDASWNNGKILTKEQSCNANDNKGNANSKTCGNCNYLTGSICKKGNANFGNFICKDVNCYNTKNGKNYKNGESWCIY